MGKLIETVNDDIIGRALLMGPIHCESQESLASNLADGCFQVQPIIAMDFSLANLTFSEE
jgi:hypothetical protein